jgi:hypothetical protein
MRWWRECWSWPQRASTQADLASSIRFDRCSFWAPRRTRGSM